MRKSSQARRTQRLMNQDNITALLRLSLIVFSRSTFSVETIALAAQLVAEICKIEDGRKMALRYKNSDNVTVVKGVAQVLSSRSCSLEACVQLCRVLGNLCWECPEGRRQIILEADRIFEPLVAILEDRDRAAKEDPGQRLPVIFPGALMNLCIDTPEAIETVAKFRCVEVVLQNVLSTRTNDAVFNSSILFLQTFVEDNVGLARLTTCTVFPTGRSKQIQQDSTYS